jgi:DNA (cytosine-5)-methyltransferase 1
MRWEPLDDHAKASSDLSAVDAVSMAYGSVCSGIEAATCAWHPLGWRPAFFSEIEAFPRAVLQHRWPGTPLHGDFTTIKAGEYGPIDLLVGGTPCQSFSVAGLRGGLDDDRGNLALEYLRLADRLRPRWLVWENVPGVLSSNGGRDFGAILGGMVELGYGVAYRILDAQFFGVAQRRRRVFAVGYLGDWRRAAAVLFERHSLSGHPAPRREAGPSVAALTAQGVGTCGADDKAEHLIPCGLDDDGELARSLTASRTATGRLDPNEQTFVAHTLKGEGFDASEDGTGPGTPIVPVCFSSKDHGADAEVDLSPTLRAGGHDGSHANAGVPPAVAFSIMPQNSGKDYKAREAEVAQPVMTGGPVGGNQGADYVVQLVAFDTTQVTSAANRSNPQPGDPCHPLGAGAHAPAVAFALRGREDGAVPEISGDHVGALRSASGGSSRYYVAFNTRQDPIHGDQAQPLGAKDNGHGVMLASAVRRLTPTECERLQGFPDDYTLIPWRKGLAPDGPRYRALGNSMAVPCMAWLGRRIAAVENLTAEPPYLPRRAGMRG